MLDIRPNQIQRLVAILTFFENVLPGECAAASSGTNVAFAIDHVENMFIDEVAKVDRSALDFVFEPYFASQAGINSAIEVYKDAFPRLPA